LIKYFLFNVLIFTFYLIFYLSYSTTSTVTLVEICELEVRAILPELGIAGRLFELAVRLGGVLLCVSQGTML
jgi:hypothetical protein